MWRVQVKFPDKQNNYSNLTLSYASHRHLPSFPTRRSSDLGIRVAVAARSGGAHVGAHAARPARDPGNARRGRSGDRKSTRLNSSHVAISYAVFWLKNKILGLGESGECRQRRPGARTL